MKKYSIYVFKTTKQLDGDDWNKQSDSDDLQERAVFEKEYDRFIYSLGKVGKDDAEKYDKAYKNGIKKLCGFFNFPAVKLKMLGVNHTAENEIVITPVPLTTVTNCKKEIVEQMFHKVEGMYEGEASAYLYPLLKNKLDLSHAGWLSVEDMNEIVKALTGVIDSRNKDYTNEFKKIARNIRKDFKRFIKMSDKLYKFYVIVIITKQVKQ